MTTASEPTRADARPSPARGGWEGAATALAIGASLVCLGLAAGLFYGFSIAVMPGLAETDDRTLVLAMQRINEEIQNPFLPPVLFGSLLFPAIAAVLQRRLGGGGALRWIVAALALYAGVLVVTIGFNIPLNDDLDQAGDPDTITNLAEVREDFEDPWVLWNITRGVLSTVALGCMSRAMLLHGRQTREALAP